LRKHQANRDQGHDILKDSHKERAIRPSKLVQQIINSSRVDTNEVSL